MGAAGLRGFEDSCVVLRDANDYSGGLDAFSKVCNGLWGGPCSFAGVRVDGDYRDDGGVVIEVICALVDAGEAAALLWEELEGYDLAEIRANEEGDG